MILTNINERNTNLNKQFLLKISFFNAFGSEKMF